MHHAYYMCQIEIFPIILVSWGVRPTWARPERKGTRLCTRRGAWQLVFSVYSHSGVGAGSGVRSSPVLPSVLFVGGHLPHLSFSHWIVYPTTHVTSPPVSANKHDLTTHTPLYSSPLWLDCKAVFPVTQPPDLRVVFNSLLSFKPPSSASEKKKPFILTFNIDPKFSCFLLSPLLDTNSSDHLLLPEFFRSLLWGFPAFPHAPLWDSTWSSHLDPLKAKVRSYNSSETIWRLIQLSHCKSQSGDGGQKAYVICLPFLVSFITTSMSAFLTTLHLPLLFLRNPYKFPLLDSF